MQSDDDGLNHLEDGSYRKFDSPFNRPILAKDDGSADKEGSGSSCSECCDQCSCCGDKSVLEAVMNFEEDEDSWTAVKEKEEEENAYGHYFLPESVMRKWHREKKEAASTIPRPRLMEPANDEFSVWKRTSPPPPTRGCEQKEKQVALARLPLPPHALGTVDRGEIHHYASASTMQRDRRKMMEELPTTADIYRNYLKRIEANAYGDPMEAYSRTMSAYFSESTRKNSERRQLEGLAAAVGFIGLILSVAMLMAYLAVQAPHLRRIIGPYYATEYHNRRHNGTADEMQRLEPKTPFVIYGVELGCSIATILLLILTNSLLIHGVRKKSAAFLLPWLIFHSFVIAAVAASVVLVLAYVDPAAFKALCLVPIVVAILLLLCWFKVLQLYKITMRSFSLGKRFRHMESLPPVNPYVSYGGPKIPSPDYGR